MMGKIEVESEENRFTRFRITLPQNEQNDLSISVTSPDKTAALREVKTEDPIEPAGTEKTDKDGKKAGTVLIVEDNEEFILISPVSSDNDIISTRPEMAKKH